MPSDLSPYNSLGSSHVTGNAQAQAARAHADTRSASWGLGKYREIIIAVAFFLVFDLGVLILNFVISFQISQDATAINLAGRQRMLSQRTTKAIYAVEDRLATSSSAGADGKELEAAINLFNDSLRAFKDGGTVAGGDGKATLLKAVAPGPGATALIEAQALWLPLLDKSRAMLMPNASPDQVKDAVAYARDNNTKLLGLMNQLTTALEADASQRASYLRWVQTIGILLALGNFVFILFKFIRTLKRADANAEAIANENREILSSVKEGLFLITPDISIGTQIAQSSHQLFGRTVQPGESFFALLKPLVSRKVLGDTKDYIDLLFSPHIKEQLVQGINPLGDVEVSTENRLGNSVIRHLSFGFNRAKTVSGVSHLLVTVQDITTRKVLEGKLKTERSRAQKEFAMLIKAFEADPVMLRDFVSRSESELLAINDLMRDISSGNTSEKMQSVVNDIFRRIHTFKGDAQTLGLEVLATDAHQMESELIKLRDAGQVTDDMLLTLPLPLDALLGKVSAFKELTLRRSDHQPVAAHSIDRNTALAHLAQQIASDCGKRVQATVQLSALGDLPAAQQDALQSMAVQLLRNAVAHGIETPALRSAAGKNAEGSVRVQLYRTEAAAEHKTSTWHLSVRDDGAGLRASQVRAQLATLGWYSEAALAALDDKQIIGHIFRPGFSTASATDAGQTAAMHAGRGVGLDAVQTQALAIGAHLSLASQPGQFTEFKLKFTA